MKKRVIAFGLLGFLILGLLVGIFIWYLNTDPLADNGLGTTTFKDGRQDEYVVQLSNEGYGKIDIRSVKINDNETPHLVQLGVTYDAPNIVQILPDEPAIEFMDINASSIFPKLTTEEFQAAIKKKEHTPMQYGIRIRHGEKIESVTIKYKYFGFTKTKKITSWFQNS
ncbi:MAG: hypothetical protein ACQEXQ_09555 [Bacillota bacterium]